MALTIVLADDHQIVRQGLRAILKNEPEFRLVGEASDGLQAVQFVERLRPDVLVLDLMMPGLSGLEVARRVVRKASRTRVVVLSMHRDEAYVAEALHAGATAYVLKECGADDLVRAIREASAGRNFFSDPISEQAVRAYARMAGSAPLDPYQTLTEREREVLHLTVEGRSGVEVAGRLFISPRTVESHRASLMRKLGVRNQKELVRYAMQRNILATNTTALGETAGEKGQGMNLSPTPQIR